MKGVMWNWSISVDKQAEEDPNFFNTDLGKACTYWAREENKRLDKILRMQRREQSEKEA